MIQKIKSYHCWSFGNMKLGEYLGLVAEANKELITGSTENSV